MTVSSKTESFFRCVIGGLLMSAIWLGPADRSQGQPVSAPSVKIEKKPPVPTPVGKAAEPAATLDRSLAEAMDKNPGIIAAKAKVALAQAQLNSMRLELARQLVGLWNDRQVQENAVKSARSRFQRTEQLYKSAAVAAEDMDSAKGALVDAEARLARTQMELRYLTGEVNLTASAVATEAATRGATIQVPRGPLVEKIRQALDSKLGAVDFQLVAVKDVADYLRDLTKIPISVDEKALSAAGSASCKLEGATLGAVLQAIEDQNRGAQFVVRDYGILLTDRAYAAEEGFLPVAEFARSKAGGTTAPAEPGKPSTPSLK